ncbi:unnamed protein product [Ixodes pacificus]
MERPGVPMEEPRSADLPDRTQEEKITQSSLAAKPCQKELKRLSLILCRCKESFSRLGACLVSDACNKHFVSLVWNGSL